MQYDGSIYIDTKISTSGADSQMATLENRISKTSDKLEEMKQKQKDLAAQKLPTDEYKEIQSQITESEKRLNALVERMQKWQDLGKSTNSSSFTSMQYDAEQLRQTIEYARAEKEELEKTGGAFINPATTAEYEKLDTQIRQTSRDLDVLNQKHEELRQKQEEVSNGSSGVSSALGKIGNRIAGLAKRIFVFSLITKAFRAMVSGVQEGLKNYVQYSAEYNKTMSDFSSSAATLKNAMATAAAPIINLFLPALTTLCGWLTTAANLISKFAAFVSGKGTWTRAAKQQKNYAKSLQDTSKAADKAKTSLAGFDDLDVLQKDDNSSGGAGGGGEVTGAGAFEEVPFTDGDIALLSKVKAILEAILPIVVMIGAALLAWKLTSFLTNLMSVHPILGTILAILFIIAGIALSIYSYVHMWKDGVDWKGLIGYIVGVSLAFAGLFTLFTPFVAGIFLIVAAVAGLVLAFKDIYENGLNVQNMSLLLVSAMGLVVGIFFAFGSTAALVVAGIIALISLLALIISKMGKTGEAVGYLRGAFEAFGKFIKDLFVGDVKTALRDICVFAVNIVNVIITAFESLINFIIDGINAIIKAAVDMANKIPGFDFDAPQIPHVQFGRLEVPELANGGITAHATYAKIGEAGREAVLPLENNLGYLDEFASRIADKIPAAQTGAVYLQVDGKTFARLMHPYSAAESKRIGVSLAK